MVRFWSLMLFQLLLNGAAPVSSGRTNRLVTKILTSRVHCILSRRICVIDYNGRKSGQRYVTPTQFALADSTVMIFVGNHESKTWWRNFVGDPHPLRVCLGGAWHNGTAVAFREEGACVVRIDLGQVE